MKTDTIDWIRLSLIPGIGPRRFMALLEAFGSPSDVLAASCSALTAIVGEKIATAILAGADPHLLDRTLAWRHEKNHRILCYHESDYPTQLKEIAYPPPILYLIGDTTLLNGVGLAMVGSRRPTRSGLTNAAQFAQALSQAGLTIISGLAAGIDAAAHRGGLEGVGSTIGVMATGADLIYPGENKILAADMADKGLLVSEFPLGTPPKAQHFPRRNRLISGLSTGCLVIEATLSSGSLITARYAMEQGREVFAIPGSIHSPQSKGPHQLIKQGAKLVDDMTDILMELKWVIPEAHYTGSSNPASKTTDKSFSQKLPNSPKKVEKVLTSPLADSEQPPLLKRNETQQQPASLPNDPILAVMTDQPMDMDKLSQLSGYSASELQVKLLELEMGGFVERSLSGHYRIV